MAVYCVPVPEVDGNDTKKKNRQHSSPHENNSLVENIDY